MIPRTYAGDRLPDRVGTWTPTWSSTGTAVSLGNGTCTGAYAIDGRRLTFTIELTWGSSTTGGTGAWGFSLPSGITTVAVGQTVVGTARDDSASEQEPVSFLVGASGASVFPGGPWTGSLIDVDSPFAWAEDDTLTITGTVLLAT